MARLISLNIERSKHLERFIPFLRRRSPDFVCLQELVARDIPAIQRATGLDHCHFVPMAIHPVDGEVFGIGILSRTAFVETGALVYAGTGDGNLQFDRTSPETRIETCRYSVALARLMADCGEMTVATTHFPWTPDGAPRPFQDDAACRLIAGLGNDPVVLTGDFNAPRGGPVFGKFARVWRDCIPADVTTSLDPDLHRAGPLELMVDGLFVSHHHSADDVRLHAGVSDHQAIAARISRPD